MDAHSNPLLLEVVYAPVVDKFGTVIEVTKIASNVTDRVNVIADTITMVKADADTTGSVTAQGQKVIDESVQRMNQIISDTQTLSTDIDKLNADVDK